MTGLDSIYLAEIQLLANEMAQAALAIESWLQQVREITTSYHDAEEPAAARLNQLGANMSIRSRKLWLAVEKSGVKPCL